jgi:hypothetical protein
MTHLLSLLFVLGSSWAQADPCAEGCADLGFCVERDGVCQPTTDAHCQAARVCREHGECYFVDAAPYAPGRCGDREERDALEASKEAEADHAAAGLLGLLAQPEPSLDTTLSSGWSDEPGLGMSLGLTPGTVDPERPVRQLDAADIQCAVDCQRHSEREPGEYSRTWCATPDGRRKGPELVVYVRGGRRMVTEYRLDQAHGEHVITEADGRVMVQGAYEGGRKHGEWRSWYVGGGPASRGRYEADRKVGVWSEWTLDGLELRCDHRDPAVPDGQCVPPQE